MLRNLLGLLLLAIVAGSIWWFLRDSAESPVPLRDPGEAVSREPAPTLAGAPRAAPVVREDDVDAAARPAGAARIRGLVVSPAGTPLPGVAVTLRRENETSYVKGHEVGAAVELLDVARLTDGDAPVARTVSDGEGRFAFEGLDPTRVLRVRAEPGPPGTIAEATVRPSADGHVVRLTVETGAPLSFRLVDAEGGGRRGTITVSMSAASQPAMESWGGGTHWTDGDGRLTLASVPAGRLRVDASIPGYGQRTKLAVAVPRNSPFVIPFGLGDGVAVYGRVRNEDGDPVANARVLAHCGSHADFRAARWMRTAESDAEGHYRIEGLPPGPVAGMECVAEGLVRPQYVYYRRVLVPGEDTRVDFDLQRGSFVRGRVVLEDGTPVARALVETAVFTGEGMAYQLTVQAGADGAYALGPLPQGQGHATPKSQGLYVVATEEQSLEGRAFVLSSPGEVLEADLLMARGTPVSGRVLDAEGAGVAGATVRLLGPRVLWQRYGPAFERVAADVAGAFVFPGLPPSETYSVRASSGNTDVEAEIRPNADNEITLPAGASVAGRVVGWDRPPPGGWRVQASLLEGKGRERVLVFQEDGQFEIHGLREGRWRVAVLDAFGNPSGAPYESDLAAGQRLTDVELRPDAFGSIEGVVVDVRGDARPGLEVTVAIPDASRVGLTVRSDGAGRFRVDRLPPGVYALSVDLASESVTARPGTTDVRVVVDLSRPVFRGMVRMPNGEPLPRGHLLVLISGTETNRSYFQVSIRSGSFSYEVEPGTTTVEFEMGEAWDARGKPVSFQAVAGSAPVDRPLELQLVAARRITGVVVDVVGRGLPGVRLYARDPKARGVRVSQHHVVTDADGSFELVGLDETASYDVSLGSVPEGYRRPETVTIGPGDTSIRIVLEAGTTVRGHVLDEAGAPIPNAFVQGQFGDVPVFANAGADGSFVLTGMPDGSTGVLWASARFGTPYLRATLKDVPAGKDDVVFGLVKAAAVTGTVLDPDGKAVGGVVVVLSGDGMQQRMTSHPDGTFRFAPVAIGSYSLRTEAHDPWLAATPVEVEAPSEKTALRLRPSGDR